jgi:hypothetical protein
MALILGDYYSFQDIACSPFGALPMVGFKSINYSDELGRQWVRGTARQPIGRTAGHYTPTMEIEMYLPGYLTFMALLSAAGLFAGGWMRVAADWTVSYGGTGPFGISIPVTTDVIPGCVVTKNEVQQAEGEEPLTRKITLMPGGPIIWGFGGPGVIEPNVLTAIG